MEGKTGKFLPGILIAVIIVIGIIGAAFIVSGTIVEIKSNSNTITVTGSAKQQITSDFVIWTGSFTSQSSSLQDAYAQLQTSRDKVQNYLVGQGLTEDEIVFSSIYTSTYYVISDYGIYTNDVDYYQLSQTVTISSYEVDEVTAISRDVTELINDGVQFQSNSPQYQYTKIADLKVTMLAEATKDATSRAQMIAENAGSSLGGLTYADMGVFQITPLYSNEVSDYGINDTSSLEKEITAVVHCQFEIK